MNSLILISIIWLVAISQCVAISQHVALRIPPAGAMVVFQWPMAFCVVEKCKEGKEIPLRFTLHGVWPTAQDGTTMTTTCPEKEFCLSEIEKLPNHKEWISYKGRDSDFMEHEWKKHGSCFKLNCADYFQSSLSLWQQKYTNILTALEKNGIKPSPSEVHRIENFYKAIVNNLNLKPIIFCKSDGNGRKYVVEIVLCATNDLNDFRNCTGSPEHHMKQCDGKDQEALFYSNNPSGGLDIKQISSQIITTATT